MKELLVESIRFALIGAANSAIGLAVIFAAMCQLDTAPIAANLLGYSAGWGVSFLLNRSWTFGSNCPIAGALARYLMVVLVSYLLNVGVVVWAMALQSVNPYFAQAIGMVIYTASAFAGCRWFVFRGMKA